MASFVALATCFVAGSLAADVPGCGCTLNDACKKECFKSSCQTNPFCVLLEESMVLRFFDWVTGYRAFGDPVNSQPRDTTMGICDQQEAEPLFQKRVGDQAIDKSTGCPLSGSMRYGAGIASMVVPVPCDDASLNLTTCDFPRGTFSGWDHMSQDSCKSTELPLSVLNGQPKLKISVGCKSWFGGADQTFAKERKKDFVDEVVLQASVTSASGSAPDLCKRGDQNLPLGMGWTAEHKQRRYKCYDVDHSAFVVNTTEAPDFKGLSILMFSVGNEPCKASCRSKSASSNISSTSLIFSSNGSARSNMWWLVAFIFNIWFVQA